MDQLLKFRRAWIGPKSLAAFEQILDGEIPEPDELFVLLIPEDRYESQIFPLLNDMERVCGVAGADFAVEEIEQARLGNVIEFLKSYPTVSGGNVDPWLADWLDRAWGMCWVALQGGLGKKGGPAHRAPDGWSVFISL